MRHNHMGTGQAPPLPERSEEKDQPTAGSAVIALLGAPYFFQRGRMGGAPPLAECSE